MFSILSVLIQGFLFSSQSLAIRCAASVLYRAYLLLCSSIIYPLYPFHIFCSVTSCSRQSNILFTSTAYCLICSYLSMSRLNFFCRILHTMFSYLRAHAFARSVTVARSSAVQASSSRRQERRWAIVWVSRSRSPPTGRRRDSPISSSLFSHGPPLCAVG